MHSESDHSRHSDPLGHAVEHAAHLLPAQGPIGVFVHHNTLHAFQHLRFDEAVQEAAQIYGTQPYLPEEEYQKSLKTGRIRPEDIGAVLWRQDDERVWPGMYRRELRPRLLLANLRNFQPEKIGRAHV